MPTKDAKSKSKQQDKILTLFNKLVQPKQNLNDLDPLSRAVAIYGTLDEKHELNDSVRVELQDQLEQIKSNQLDPNLVLTDGPFKGSTITWVCAYVAASDCSFPELTRTKTIGYPYLLNRLINLSTISQLDFTTTFKATQLKLSALWLAIYADLRHIARKRKWFTDRLLKELRSDQLRALDVNAIGLENDGSMSSVLGLLIKNDYLSKVTHEYVYKLLSKVPPLKHPEFYKFNQNALDKNNKGMTTLCQAAQLEADQLKKDVTISANSPFFAIIEATKEDLGILDLNARIREGKNKGKSPLWYAAYVATTQVYDSLDTIMEYGDLDLLDFNAKAEDANDDDANISVLWLTSFLLANYRHGYPLLMILRYKDDLSTLDFNNCATSNVDGDKGKTVLWQCAVAALNGQDGDDEALQLILDKRDMLKLDYTAKAESGSHANQRVCDLIIQLARRGNVLALIKMLQDKNRPQGIEQQIPAQVWAVMFQKLRLLSLKKKDYNDFKLLQDVLLAQNFQTSILNEVSEHGEYKGQTALMHLVELALSGFPLLLNRALKATNETLTCDEPLVEPTLSLLINLKKQCYGAAMMPHTSAASLLSEFLSDNGSPQEYVEITDNVDALVTQFTHLKLKADEEIQKQSVLDGKLKFTRSKWEIS